MGRTLYLRALRSTVSPAVPHSCRQSKEGCQKAAGLPLLPVRERARETLLSVSRARLFARMSLRLPSHRRQGGSLCVATSGLWYPLWQKRLLPAGVPCPWRSLVTVCVRHTPCRMLACRISQPLTEPAEKGLHERALSLSPVPMQRLEQKAGWKRTAPLGCQQTMARLPGMPGADSYLSLA